MKIDTILEVRRADGIHARPAGELVKIIKNFQSQVEFIHGNKHVNGKSVIQIMTLTVKQGSQLRVIIEGDDAEDVTKAITAFLQ